MQFSIEINDHETVLDSYQIYLLDILEDGSIVFAFGSQDAFHPEEVEDLIWEASDEKKVMVVNITPMEIEGCYYQVFCAESDSYIELKEGTSELDFPRLHITSIVQYEDAQGNQAGQAHFFAEMLTEVV